ncbi:MAG: YeeE/YedE family protein [Geminicoccaceae bacterium]
MNTASTTLIDRPTGPTPNTLVVAIAAGALVLLTIHVGQSVGTRMAWLALIGAGLGMALYHGAFGFTAGWRRFIAARDGRSLRLQFLVIALVMVAAIPIIGGVVPGLRGGGNFGPVGVSVLVGAFIFGFGMQLGNGCGSGTLFTVGGGSVRMVVTLVFFIVGSVIGTLHLPWWLDQPSLGPLNLGRLIGVPWAVLLQLLVLGGLAWLTLGLERKRHPDRQTLPPGPSFGFRPGNLLSGPWPQGFTALVLAALALLTLVVGQQTWGITQAFGIWGAKVLTAVGVDLSQTAYWGRPGAQAALERSVFEHTVSVMDFGLIIGAMLAAALAGKFKPSFAIPLRSLVAAVLGGLLLGYGARLGFGCNIGAFFSGIASGSLHGWLWFGSAYLGSMLGVAARPIFGLARI